MLTTKVGPDGRILVPVELRRELGLKAGDPIVARAEDGRLVIESRDAVVRRLQSSFDVVPHSVSLVDELVADRRAEAERETR
jgi:AbrB family looped-hinge helix DNA binding protein